MKTTRWIHMPVVLLVVSFASGGCSICGPEQHAITTASPNDLILDDGSGSRQVQYVNTRLTEPPATHDQFQFTFNTLEGQANGEGVALSFNGTDAGTMETVTLVLALPVALRQGDDYAVGSTFSVEVGSASETGFWGQHDLVQSNKADVAFVIAKYTFPPPEYAVQFRAVSSSGTVHVVSRTAGHVQLALNLSFTDANGNVRTLTGDAQADNEKRAALCN
ncbi:MAG: hypothetical protein ACJ8AF_00210 [Gemmatimonadaceae bacterium]